MPDMCSPPIAWDQRIVAERLLAETIALRSRVRWRRSYDVPEVFHVLLRMQAMNDAQRTFWSRQRRVYHEDAH